MLQNYSHLLPSQGQALDLACGLGGNAIHLAKSGLSVDAWDISPVAIGILDKHTKSEKLLIQADVRDVLNQPPKADWYDVIIVSYFLERSLVESIYAALRPNGLLFYQTFTRTKITEAGPNNPHFLLSDNELLKLFSGLQILVYREEGRVGDIKKGLRNEALFVGQKIETKK